MPDGPPWPAPQPTRDDDLDVHVGRHYEMHTPRRQRPHQELGLVIGKLYLDGCLANSGTGTLSSAESEAVHVIQPGVAAMTLLKSPSSSATGDG